MDSAKKNGRIMDYKNSIKEQIATIKENDIKEAQKLSDKTSPGFASLWTGVPKEVIISDKKKFADEKAAEKLRLQERSRKLYEVDNGYLAKANKAFARKTHGFTDQEIQKILAFRKKENDARIKMNEPGIMSRAYENLRNYFRPEKVEEEKWIKKQTTKQHREKMRKKYGV